MGQKISKKKRIAALIRCDSKFARKSDEISDSLQKSNEKSKSVPRVALKSSGRSPAPTGDTSILVQRIDDADDTIHPTPTVLEGEILERSNFVIEKKGSIDDFYTIDKQKLGQGSYGYVSKARNILTGQVRAIKVLAKGQIRNYNKLFSEVNIMKNLDHPNIVKLYETFEDSLNIYLVLEFCDGGELFDRIISAGSFTEKDAARFTKQMFSAISYLHCKNIMHRDIKPENFLLASKSDDTLKLIDFGLSCVCEVGGSAHTKAGTPYYVAPEVLAGNYDIACDMWSCGVIMYILLCGYPPFYGDTDASVLMRVREAKYTFENAEWENISLSAKDLISKLLVHSPSDRYKVSEALAHPWIVEMTSDAVVVEPSKSIMQNLVAFRGHNRLKRAALTIIAHSVAETQVDDLRKLFVSLDKDSSGTLSVQEIVDGLRNSPNFDLPPDLHSILFEIDSDGSGFVDYTEFIAATMDKLLYIEEDLCYAAFKVFDLDGDGKISPDEISTILNGKHVADKCNMDSVMSLLKQVDLDGDGLIDFAEFLAMMRRIKS